MAWSLKFMIILVRQEVIVLLPKLSHRTAVRSGYNPAPVTPKEQFSNCQGAGHVFPLIPVIKALRPVRQHDKTLRTGEDGFALSGPAGL
jgi:hypothetical protein